MSDLAEKLEAPAAQRDSIARCSLAQLRARWGTTSSADGHLPSVGDEVKHWGMGEAEVWRVTGVQGTKPENVSLERIDR